MNLQMLFYGQILLLNVSIKAYLNKDYFFC